MGLLFHLSVLLFVSGLEICGFDVHLCGFDFNFWGLFFISRVWKTKVGKCYKDSNLKKKIRCSPISAFVPVLATMELADLGHHLGVGLLTDRWVW